MSTVINIKTDKKTKKEAQKIAKEMGLPLSTVINGYLKQFITERQMTFRAPLRPTKKLEKILAEAQKDIKEGKNLSPEFNSVEEMNKYLDAL